MIAVESHDGELVKIVNNVMDSEFGFHRVFGFISKENAEKRSTSRKRQGFDFTNDEWLCQFKLVSSKDGKLNISGLKDCDVTKEKDKWSLQTPLGEFALSQHTKADVQDYLVDKADKNIWLDHLAEIMLILLMLLIPLMYFMIPAVPEEEELEDIAEPITVQIIKQVKTVKIAQQAKPNIKVKPLTKSQVSKRAVKRNLGFLGMLGSKDLKKVVGGVPQELTKATAGAGAGGDAGSGGEVLTGLGKGLKKTTVGNTGVQGLGGVGTKGAGGGKGGYGNTSVASGEGAGISSIAVSSSDVVLQGGISRYAIRATIAKYLSQVRRCYEKQLAVTPGIQGLVEMSFQINSLGRLNYARVNKSLLNNKPTEACISKKMINWKFPKPKGGVNVDVKYPFMLRPVGQ
jgi:hypothetical protein